VSIALNGRIRALEQAVQRLTDKLQTLDGLKKVALQNVEQKTELQNVEQLVDNAATDTGVRRRGRPPLKHG
jgi:hypothetical protein